MTIPPLNNQVYVESSPEATYLRHLCSNLCGDALSFGARVHRIGIDRLRGTIDYDDPRGFILGLVGKAFDLVSGIRVLGAAGSIGPAIGQIRSLFESYLTLRYVTEADTNQRLWHYRINVLREIRKMWAHLADSGDEKSAQRLHNLEAQVGRAALAKQPKHWTTRNIKSIAHDLGLDPIYAGLYRTATKYTHTLDIDDRYNPIMLETFEPEQPHFITNLGCWSALDVLGIMTCTHSISWSHFGVGARFLSVDISDEERELVASADYALSPSYSPTEGA